jgi:hypothetical protein
MSVSSEDEAISTGYELRTAFPTARAFGLERSEAISRCDEVLVNSLPFVGLLDSGSLGFLGIGQKWLDFGLADASVE